MVENHNDYNFNYSLNKSINKLLKHSRDFFWVSSCFLFLSIAMNIEYLESQDDIDLTDTIEFIESDYDISVPLTEGEVKILVTGSTMVDAYNWSTGEVSRFIRVTEPGLYSVTVNDYQGNLDVIDFEVFYE